MGAILLAIGTGPGVDTILSLLPSTLSIRWQATPRLCWPVCWLLSAGARRPCKRALLLAKQARIAQGSTSLLSCQCFPYRPAMGLLRLSLWRCHHGHLPTHPRLTCRVHLPPVMGHEGQPEEEHHWPVLYGCYQHQLLYCIAWSQPAGLPSEPCLHVYNDPRLHAFMTTPCTYASDPWVMPSSWPNEPLVMFSLSTGAGPGMLAGTVTPG